MLLIYFYLPPKARSPSFPDAIAAVWWPLALVLTAVAVAIVGVVVLRGNSESLNRNEPSQCWDCIS
jgi:hypothetical protein